MSFDYSINSMNLSLTIAPHLCYNYPMTKTATINSRIAPKLKKEAEAIFAQLGLSTSEAITLFLQTGFIT